MRHAGDVSLLLEYPTDRTLAACREVVAGLGRERGPAAAGLRAFAARAEALGLAGLQRAYVETIDFDARASLHLTYHLHGDHRRRGEALIALKRRYAEAGLLLHDGGELPDHLAVVLEFAELAPAEGERLLGELREPLELVRARLHELDSPYAALLDAVAGQLPRLSARRRARLREMAAEGPPTELVGLEPAGAVPAPSREPAP